MLIDRGADVNYKDKNGNTPLMIASRYSSIETAKLLIDRGADVNARNKRRNTALILAISEEIINLLKEAGAK